MSGYESIIIFDPNITEEDQKGLLSKFNETIQDKGGNVIHQSLWGRRKLAYPVKKMDYGIYHLLYLDQAPDALKALELALRLDESVLMWQTVSVENVDEEFTKFEKLKENGSLSKNLSDR